MQSAGAAPEEAGRRRRRKRHQPMSEINVTPFVDVMLVLLIIFMVAAPLLTVGVPLAEQVLLSAGMCLVSVWLGVRLYRAEKDAARVLSPAE